MKILITGGAGYIGSITNLYLLENGYETVIFDNMSLGHLEAISKTRLIKGDLRNKNDIATVFKKESFDAVIHFAALALAGESMVKPYDYFWNNIQGGLNLMEAMRLSSCRSIIFSSTCAVYGYPNKLPVTEDTNIQPVSVYGASKRSFEQIIQWYEQIYGIRSVILRYFNASGAYKDGSLGEDHHPETHIIPIAIKVANGKQSHFELYGDDYETKDGTCVRDYIHVMDLADAHLKAAKYLVEKSTSIILNLGIGKGYSNFEVLKAIEKISGKKIKIVIQKRRPGDPAEIFADNLRAKSILGWNPRFTNIESIVDTAWNWHSLHPNGYR